MRGTEAGGPKREAGEPAARARPSAGAGRSAAPGVKATRRSWARRGRERLSAGARALDRAAGSAWASGISAVVVFGLLILGLVVRFPPWWQTLVYSAGALVSLLLLFAIQHNTRRQNQAVLLKLDELIRASRDADDEMMGLEERGLHEQEHLHRHHRQRREQTGVTPP